MTAGIGSEGMRKVAEASGQWFVFQGGEDRFALPLEGLREVLRPLPLKRVPLAPEGVRGLLNLRGRILPVLELRRLLDLAPYAGPLPERWLVLQTPGGEWVLAVDGVEGILDIPAGAWETPPENLGPARRAHLMGMCAFQERMILGLNVDGLWTEGDET